MPVRFEVQVGDHGKTSAAIWRAVTPRQVTVVLAHGAGAPRTHPFMVDLAARLAARGVDVVTFNFLYAEAGRKLPDRMPLLEATWRAVIAAVRARRKLPTARLFIGGKSMGGRVATHIAAADDGRGLAGVALLGYPLHPPGNPARRREEILAVQLPVLVVQGTRDALGTAAEMRDVVALLPRGSLVPVEGGDHSFALPRSEASLQAAVRDAVADAVAGFVCR